MQMRIAYHGLIYHKILRLSSHSLNAFGSGQITNIFSNDGTQIAMTAISSNYLWVNYIWIFYLNEIRYLKSAPIDIIVVIIFFWYFVKYISFMVIGYTIVIVLLTSLIGHFIVYFRWIV